MKLEIGKKYNTKGAGIVEIFAKSDYAPHWGAMSQWGVVWYTIDGVLCTGDDKWTIVSEICDQE